MLDNHRIGGLLLMGGVGQRFGSELPKQFHRLSGKMVFLHTLEAFLATQIFDEIVLCCHPKWLSVVKNMLAESKCPIRIVSAGTTRQESSYLGLLGFSHPPDIVIIHDAVRPFVSQEIIIQNAKQAIRVGAVDTCIPSTDTLVHAPEATMIESVLKRSEYLRGQTPQSFSYQLILDAHRQTKLKDCSDDCRLVIDLNHPVSIVAGDEHNIKITSELDLFIAEQLLRMRLNHPIRKNKSSSLENQKYVIVGGTGGIGSAIQNKIHLMKGQAIALSRQTFPIHLDLCNPESIEKAFEEIHQRFGCIDGLINCAGQLSVKTLDQLSFEEIDTAIDVNLKGLILSCKLARLNVGAHVINIASSSFSRGRKNTTIYSSTKAGVVNFTQGWAEERPDLHVHAIIPQRTNTPLRRKNFPSEDVSELLDPEKIADAVIDLLLDHDYSGLLVEVRKK